MTIPEAARQLKLSEQLLRVWAKSKNGCPFITIVREGQRNTYLVNPERMKLWSKGKI